MIRVLFPPGMLLIILSHCIGQSTGTFTDERNGIAYNTITIGNDTWMAENLNLPTDSGSWCYLDDTSYCKLYGRLYTQAVASRVCPTGWHLPGDSEFAALIASAQEDPPDTTSAYQALIINELYGFDAFLAGYRDHTGKYWGLGSEACFWSSSHYAYGIMYKYLHLNSLYQRASITNSYQEYGYSVRCVKDQLP